jgi:hypothetical protein
MANSALVPVEFPIPEELLQVLQGAYDQYVNKTHGAKSPAAEGMKRCRRLLSDKKLKYYQIKRMIHDMEQINPLEDPVSYALNGGRDMYVWATRTLDDARRKIEADKNSRARANEIGGLDGIRKNAYLSTHEKSGGALDGILFGAEDQKSSITPMVSEQVERICALMKQTNK